MRRFRYGLERLLELRKHQERDWEIALAKVVGECLALRARIEECRESKKRSYAAEGAGLDELIAAELYRARMEQEIDRYSAQLVAKEKERAKVQEKYLEASRKRKVLDKLREKKEQMYYKEQWKVEFNQQDEINQARELRKRIQDGV